MNILETIRGLLTPEIMGQLSRSVGESPDSATRALDYSLPALLGSAVSKASSPDGANSLLNLLKEKTPQGGWPTAATSLLGKLPGEGVDGSSLESSLLGSKASMLRNFIATRSGIRSESASSLLGIAGQLLMGVLGRLVATQGLGASSFVQLLRSQIPHLQGSLPSELAGMLGIGNLLTPTAAAAPSSSSTQAAAREEHELVGAGAPTRGRVLRWALLPLALLLGAIFVYQHNRQSNMGGTSEDTFSARNAGTVVSSNLQAAQIDITRFTDHLRTAIAGSDGTPVDLQGVNFDTSGNLSQTGRRSLSALGNLLNNNPSLKITITTYGATADEAAARASAIKSALVSAGIAADRVATEPQIGEAIPKVSFTK